MKIVLIIFSLALLSACSTRISDTTILVDTVYLNGTIWTGQAGAQDAKVLAVKDGQVVYVGDGTANKFEATTQVDLNGKFLMPGFRDNHVHFFEGGAALTSVDLRDASTPAVFAKRIADYAASLAVGRWVLNGNWDHELWGGKLPRKDWIDKDTSDYPVYVIRVDGHMALANSKALELASINASTIAPDGGEIMRDQNGELTGILKGNALNLMLDIIPQLSEQEVLETFSAAQSHALSLGLTHIHAVTAYPTETTMLDMFKLARDRGVMKIRAYVSMPIEDLNTAVETLKREGGGKELLSWGGVKGFVDGSLGASTAWFYQPYDDEPDAVGAPLNKPSDLKQWMSDADDAGLRLTIHAIGDQAIDQAIGNMRDIAGDEINAKRYRIEHFQHPSRSAINTAAEYGIIASMQPYHAIDDGRWAESRIGSERIKTTYAFRTLLDAGVVLTFGSDWPVAPLSPLEGIYAAVTRRTTDSKNPNGWQAQEKIGVEEALTAYTATNAYAVFEEDKSGTIAAGKRVDLVILSNDPRKVRPEKIRKIKVLSTVIGGEEVFRVDGASESSR